MLNEQMIRDELSRRDGYLRRGPHRYFPGCSASARELRSALLAKPWSRTPEHSNTDEACNALNDALWSSDAARTKGCIPLVMLAEAEAVRGWVPKYVEATIKLILPLALRRAERARPLGSIRTSLRAAANLCAQEGGLEAAGFAAHAARFAHRTARSSDFNDAALEAYAERTISSAHDAAYTAFRAARAADIGPLLDAAAGTASVAAAVASVSTVTADYIMNYAVSVLLACHRGEDPMLLDVPDV